MTGPSRPCATVPGRKSPLRRNSSPCSPVRASDPITRSEPLTERRFPAVHRTPGLTGRPCTSASSRKAIRPRRSMTRRAGSSWDTTRSRAIPAAGSTFASHSTGQGTFTTAARASISESEKRSTSPSKSTTSRSWHVCPTRSTVSVAADAPPGKHIFRLEWFDPDGRYLDTYSKNHVAVGGEAVVTIQTALNEPIGKHKLVFRDVATGRVTETTVRVAAAKRKELGV